MAFNLDRFGVMEHLWETLDKTPDGAHIRYQDMDVAQLWWMGFVDTQRLSLEDWLRIFEPYLQDDGSYLLNKDQFLSLDQYRYTGEIRIPFDPMLINEGKYTEEGLDELVAASIAPSCSLPDENLKEFFSLLKKDFRQPDGLILIKTAAKQRMKALLDEHPSPMRNLEIMLDSMLTQQGQELLSEVEGAKTERATTQAAMQASRFSATPTSRSEQRAKGLDALQKARKHSNSSEVEGVGKVELKKVKRSRKGMRG